jgi:hypothetical protein
VIWGLAVRVRTHAVFLDERTRHPTASLWSDVQQGDAWVYRAAHLLTNDEMQKAAQIRHAYEVLLAEMEQAPTSSETLTTMLSAFRPRDHQLLAWPLSLLRSC